MQQLSDAPAASLRGFRGLRAELLVALKKAPHALTARELAGRFALTPNALRRYLKALEDEGLVRYRREVRGVGAPVYAYSLTEGGQALFPQAYAPVLTAVLQAVRDTAGPEGVRAVLRRQWAPLVEGAPDRLAALPLAERAQLVAEFRSSQGFMAEATMIAPGVARIREHHCALREVAEQFPELCAAEQELLEELLGVPLERTCHIPTGCSSCAYVAREPDVTALGAAPVALSARPDRRAPDRVSSVPSPTPDTV